MSIVLNIDKPNERERALVELPGLLRRGGICLLPTDTVYGICCCTLKEEVERRVAKLKGKDSPNTIPILINSLSMLSCFVEDISPIYRKLMDMYWPSPLTIIIATRNGERGFRMPFDSFLLRLIELTGPLSISSANIHGENPLVSLGSLKKVFPTADAYLCSNRAVSEAPSTVVKLNETGNIEVLRHGALDVNADGSVL